jgi:hypothetical protein
MLPALPPENVRTRAGLSRNITTQLGVFGLVNNSPPTQLCEDAIVTKDLADEGIVTCPDGGHGEAPLLLPRFSWNRRFVTLRSHCRRTASA